MTRFLQILSLALLLLVVSQTLATSEDSDADQSSSLQLPDDASNDGDQESRFPGAMGNARLARLQQETRFLIKWLAEASHSTGELDKRFKPSGFLGSRGKRYIPGLESFLLSRYYKDAEKRKRQPHLGFHGSRG